MDYLIYLCKILCGGYAFEMQMCEAATVLGKFFCVSGFIASGCVLYHLLFKRSENASKIMNQPGLDKEIQTSQSENRSRSANALSHGLSLSTLNPEAKEFIFPFREESTLRVNDENNSCPSFADLPDVPLLKIFSYLDNKDLNRAGLTCSRWYDMSRRPSFWCHITIASHRQENLRNYLPVIPDSVSSLRISCVRSKLSAKALMDHLRKFGPKLDSLRIERASITDTKVLHLFSGNITFRRDRAFPGQFPKDIRELSLEGCCLDLRHLLYGVFVNASIEILNLTSCIGVYDRSVRYLRALDNLQELYLSKCQVTDKGAISVLCNIPNLNVLDLEGCFVTDRTLIFLKYYGPSLRRLYIGYTLVTDAGLMSLSGCKADLPNLKTLCVRCTHVTRWGVEESKARFVSDVDISWCCWHSDSAINEKCVHYGNRPKDPLSACHIEFI